MFLETKAVYTNQEWSVRSFKRIAFNVIPHRSLHGGTATQGRVEDDDGARRFLIPNQESSRTCVRVPYLSATPKRQHRVRESIMRTKRATSLSKAPWRLFIEKQEPAAKPAYEAAAPRTRPIISRIREDATVENCLVLWWCPTISQGPLL